MGLDHNNDDYDARDNSTKHIYIIYICQKLSKGFINIKLFNPHSYDKYTTITLVLPDEETETSNVTGSRIHS